MSSQNKFTDEEDGVGGADIAVYEVVGRNNDDDNNNNNQSGDANNNQSEDVDDGRKKYKINTYSVYMAVIAAVGGLIYGWDVGSSLNVTSAGFDHYFKIECDEEEEDCTPRDDIPGKYHDTLIIGIDGITTVVGALIVAPLIFDWKGRKATMFAGVILVFLGSVFEAASVNIEMFYIFFSISNCGVGMLNMCCPTYLIEIGQVHYRGQFVIIWSMGVSVGLLIVSFVNIWFNQIDYNDFNWRFPYIGDIIFSFIFFWLVRILPESPHYLVMKNRDEEAKEVLNLIRNHSEEIEWELKELKKEAQLANQQGKKKCTDLIDNQNSKMGTRLFIGIMLQFFNAFSGIAALSYYAPAMMESIGAKDKATEIAIFFMNLLNLIIMVGTFFFIEQWGRPLILLLGSVAMTVSITLILVVQYLTRGPNGYAPNPGIGDAIFFLIFAILFQTGFSFSWISVPWLYCAELFDIKTRGRCVGITTAAHFLFSTILQYTLIQLVFLVPTPKILSFFVAICALSLPFVYFFLPETTNKTASEVGQEFVNFKTKCLRLDWGP